MKKIFYFVALAAAVLFSSCSKDAEKSIVNEVANAGLRISFTLPTDATKADVAGVGNENVITDISVFIYDLSGNEVVGNGTKIPIADFTKNGNNYTSTDASLVKTSAGNRKVYLAANVPSGFTAPLTETSLKLREIDIANTNPTSFVMFSPVVGLPVQGQIQGETAAANANKNVVDTDFKRITSKVVVSTTNTNLLLEQNFTNHSVAGIKITYTFDKWDTYQNARSVYAIEGTQTTGKRYPFQDAALGYNINVNGTVTGNWAQATPKYIGENIPGNELKGEATYALLRAKAVPSHKATASGAVVSWATASVSDWANGFVLVIDPDKKAYFCTDVTAANAVANAVGGESYTFPGSYVYFRVMLNEADDAKILRNQLIHVNVTGIVKDIFAGNPGQGPDGEKPTNPTEPQQPNPLDPDEPVVLKDAYLKIDVTVKDWLYKDVDVELKP